MRHGRDKLAALLWGRQTDTQARHNLRQCLASLRKGLGAAAGSVIDADPVSITLRSDAIEIDLGALRHFAQANALAEAAGLCKGELLADFNLREEGFEDWLSLERQTAQRLQAEVLRRYAEDRIEAGDAEAAVASAENLVNLDPLDEPARRLTMRALAAAGRRSAALAQYQAATVLLEQELGVRPEAETTALMESIKRGEGSGGAPSGVAAPAAIEAGAAPPAIVVGGGRRSGRQSRCCPSTICRATRSRSTSQMASSRTSSPPCPGIAGFP